jgi:hypothetical protein
MDISLKSLEEAVSLRRTIETLEKRLDVILQGSPSTSPPHRGPVPLALADVMARLAALDVAYLKRYGGEYDVSPVEWFRGRLRQALDGTWVFNTFAGQNGVVGVELGLVDTNWWSNTLPSDAAIEVHIDYTRIFGGDRTYLSIVLTSVLSSRFTE